MAPRRKLIDRRVRDHNSQDEQHSPSPATRPSLVTSRQRTIDHIVHDRNTPDEHRSPSPPTRTSSALVASRRPAVDHRVPDRNTQDEHHSPSPPTRSSSASAASRRTLIDRRIHNHCTLDEHHPPTPLTRPSSASVDANEEDVGTPSTQESKRPRVRGTAQGVALNRLRPGETFFINLVDGYAVGINSELFQSQLGILTRSIIPITIRDFRRDVTREMRDLLMKRLRESFSWESSDELDKMILSHASELHRSWRFRIKRDHFDESILISQLLANVPEGITEEDWRTLVDYWTSKEYKAMQCRNTYNRSKLTHASHRMGRKNTRQLEHELVKKGIDTDRCNLFIYSKSREGKDGSRLWHDKKLQKQHEHMMALQHPNDGSPAISPDAAYLQATGPEHPGRVRGAGGGVNPSKYYGYKGQPDRSLHDRVTKLEVMLAEIAKSVAIIARAQEASSSKGSRSSQRDCSSSGMSRGMGPRRDDDEDSEDDAYFDDFALDE